MQIIQRSLLILFGSLLTLTSIFGQRVNYTNTALTFIQNNFTKYNLKAEDVQNLKISSQTYDNKNDITRYYFSQTVNDIEIYSSIWPIIVKNENKVWGVTPSFIFDAFIAFYCQFYLGFDIR